MCARFGHPSDRDFEICEPRFGHPLNRKRCLATMSVQGSQGSGLGVLGTGDTCLESSSPLHVASVGQEFKSGLKVGVRI